jgi:hypothetical protein
LNNSFQIQIEPKAISSANKYANQNEDIQGRNLLELPLPLGSCSVSNLDPQDFEEFLESFEIFSASEII